MTKEHWFDALSISLTAIADRRGFLGLAGALIAGQANDGGFLSASAKGRGKGGNGRRGKGHHPKHKGNKGKPEDKPPKPPDDSDIPPICYRNWPGEAEAGNREWCKFVWEQCPPGGDEQFCIVRDDPYGYQKHAACCATGEACCDGICRDIWSDTINCGGCGRRCPPYETCSAGECHCDLDLYDECAGIGCVNTLRDPNNCGSCGNECPFWTVCINGECKCPPGRIPCDANPNLPYPDCIRPNDVCCFPNVCGGGGAVCCYAPNGAGHCLTECPDGWRQGAP